MINRILFLLLLCISVQILHGEEAQTDDSSYTNVILIGWDGADRRRVKEGLEKELLPNLAALASDGAIVAIDAVRITSTKAGWTQILTGYEPEVTGVFSKNRYRSIPKGYTVFERLEKHFGRDNIATAAVISDGSYLSANPQQWIPIRNGGEIYINPEENVNAGTIALEKGLMYHVKPARSFYRASLSMDAFLNDLGSDSNTVNNAIELIEKYHTRRFFFFIHLSEIDKKGHKFGENSKKYMKALVSADKMTGLVIGKLKEMKLYGRTLVYVTSDHGFDRNMKTHHDAPYIFLATNDTSLVRRGLRVDIAPTIYFALGVDMEKFEPQLDGFPLQKTVHTSLW